MSFKSFGSLAARIVDAAEARAASPPPLRASDPTRCPPALAVRGENDGQHFQRKERAR